MKSIHMVLLCLTLWTFLIAARAVGAGAIYTQGTPIPQESAPASVTIAQQTSTTPASADSTPVQAAPIQASRLPEPAKTIQPDKISEIRWLISENIEIVIGIALIGLIFIGLHLLNIIQSRRNRAQLAAFKVRVDGMSNELQRLITFITDSEKTAKSVDAKVEKHQLMSEYQVNSQEKLRDDVVLLFSHVDQLREQVHEGIKSFTDTTNAIAMACEWQVRRFAQEAIATRLVSISDQEALSNLQQQAEMMETVTQRVRPLTNEFGSVYILVQQNGSFSKTMQECAGRLLSELRSFEQIEAGIRQKIKLLQKESPTERLATFRERGKNLVELFQSQRLPVSEYVREYYSLIDNLFPVSQDMYSETASPLNREREGEQAAVSAPDFLMDWMDDFIQLYGQIPDDPELAQHFTKILKLARDVLGKFNLQMEEVQLGQTLFDRRIHDAAMITASSQYPANTIIGLQQNGFRRKSTGEVLRRPQVIVVGSGGTTI